MTGTPASAAIRTAPVRHSRTVKLLLNGEGTALDDGITVGALVDGLGKGRRGLAVAVNEEVVPRSRWDTTVLCDDDRVEVLAAAQGG